MSAARPDVRERRDDLPPRVVSALALAEIAPSKLGATRHASLAESERELYFSILRRFTTTGRPPATEIHEIARGRGLDAEQVLETLARHDLVHLDASAEIAVAYPFSGRPTAHRIRFPNGHEAFAMCAIDALGIAPMFESRPRSAHPTREKTFSAIHSSRSATETTKTTMKQTTSGTCERDAVRRERLAVVDHGRERRASVPPFLT